MLQFTDADILVPLYSLQSQRRPWDPLLPAPKNNTYIGQMKLFASELAFLNLGCSAKLSESVIVYAGAASGQHIPALAMLYPNTEFWLYDPAPFAISPSDQIKIIRGLFTDEVAAKWARSSEPVIFISDVRTSGDTKDEHESEVAANMEMQAKWLDIMRPRAWSLKFRIPFTVVEAKKPFSYLGGRLIYQPYAPPLSMELRLLGNSKQAAEGSRAVQYDSEALEQTVFYHNTVIRPDRDRYLNVFTDDATPYGNPEFDNGYDCSYLLHCVKRYQESPEAVSSSRSMSGVLNTTRQLIENISQGRWNLAMRKSQGPRARRVFLK